MENIVIKKFVKDLKTSLKTLCKSDVVLYTCFNRFLAEKYIETKELKGIKDFLYSGFPEIFNNKTSRILSKLADFDFNKTIFKNIEIFDLCFQYYNFDEDGFLKKTQFYTPQKLAEKICAKVIFKEMKNILEPSCGSGVFLREIYNEGKKQNISFDITAFEIDKRALQLSQMSFSINAYEKYGEKILLKIENKDFILSNIENKFDCIIANPPFLGKKFMPKEYRDYIKQNYNFCIENLAYGFLLKSFNMLNSRGSLGFIIPENLFYLCKTKDLKNFIETNYETEILKTEKNVFKDVYGSKLSPCIIFAKNKRPEIKPAESKKILTIGDIAAVVVGIQTGNNKKYVKHFKEILPTQCAKNIFQKGRKWYPYLKGGGFKKWSGNDEFFIYYENNGEQVRKEKNSIIRNEKFFKKEGITYSYYCENRFSARYKEKGTIFDIGGSCLFFDSEDDLYYVLAFLNSSVGLNILVKMNPTMSFQTSTIKNLPLIIKNKKRIVELAKKAVELSKKTDKLFADSKYFKNPDFIKNSKNSFIQSFLKSENKFWKLKNDLNLTEKEINEIFEKIYNIHPEKVYAPKPLSKKKIQKKMILDFLRWAGFKNFEDVKAYMEEKYPLTNNDDLRFIARILNGKTFNDVKGTIEKMF